MKLLIAKFKKFQNALLEPKNFTRNLHQLFYVVLLEYFFEYTAFTYFFERSKWVIVLITIVVLITAWIAIIFETGLIAEVNGWSKIKLVLLSTFSCSLVYVSIFYFNTAGNIWAIYITGFFVSLLLSSIFSASIGFKEGNTG